MTRVATINIDNSYKELDLLSAFAKELDFPDYSGKNINAFWDLMTDLSWVKEKDIEIQIKGFEDIVSNYDPIWTINFLTILGEISRYWDGVNGAIDPLDQGVKHRIIFKIEYNNGAINQIGGDIWPWFGDGWTVPDVWAGSKEINEI